MTGSRVDVVDQQDLLAVSIDDVVSVATLALEMEDHSGHVEVALVDDGTISELHARFLDDPTPTDVITFPLSDSDGIPDSDGVRNLGEIVVSTETALRQAPEFGSDPVHEALLYVVHGVLHLLGYDDREEDERERMSERQASILEAWLSGRRAQQ